ncbi:MAG: Uma2 family endonuclease [Chloroflexota bacterium]|nr:Uma2 family endonuclease [Chloroflexota bacterium]MDE2910500.1 Uma2 family endonuclease [Chloroflexota bacterium]
MLVERQYISAEGFLDIVDSAGYEDRSIELVEGEIIEMSKASGLHGQITMLLSIKIASHVVENRLGIVTAAETGFMLERNPVGRDTVRALDIAFLSSETVPAVLPDQLVDVAPDLAVEVISPSNEAADIHHKIRQLLAAGTTLVWIVYPRTRTVEVHTRSGAATLESDDILSGGDVLPGFEIPVREIFPDPAPS